MKTAKLISELLVIAGLFLLLTNCKKQLPQTTDRKSDSIANQIRKHEISENTYDGLRQSTFNTSPEQLGLNDLKVDEIYGVIMDCGLTNGLLTLIAYKTGDASLFYDSGIVIKESKNENIHKASKHLVESANNYFNSVKKTEELLNPDRSHVNFYFLTNEGVYYTQEEVSNVESSSWESFYKEAFKLVDALIFSKVNGE